MKTVQMHNLIILDESGSMGVIKESTISGFNEIVQTIKSMEIQFPEQKHFISLVYFNGNGIRTLLNKQSVTNLREINGNHYQPSSSTPLYDAIGFSLTSLKHDLQSEDGIRVLVTILTDGEENASREYSGNQIHTLIAGLKREGWVFTYIGANHDVENTALRLSITNTIEFKSCNEDVKKMFDKEKNARANYSRNIRESKPVQENFYEKE